MSLFNGYDKALNTELPPADMIVFDIQDIGLRFFTYIVTLYYTMVLCKRAGIPLLVLDRYNPLGLTKTEGTMLEPEFASHITKGYFHFPLCAPTAPLKGSSLNPSRGLPAGLGV